MDSHDVNPAAVAVASNTPSSALPGRTRWPIAAGALILAIPLVVWGANAALIGRPISEALTSDTRNAVFNMRGHYQHYVVGSTLVLDLTSTTGAAPADLTRGLFQVAREFAKADRHFERVILAGAGTERFVLPGLAFYTLGAEFEAGQNPVYLIRTLPEKLSTPTGEPAFGTWTGGFLGVTTRQMEDVSSFARQWAPE